MASRAEWVEGARLRTLPAAIAPVLAGSAIAISEGGFSALRAVLAALVALALQIGVNYSNDYSDGVRGTDAARVGPQRLVGSGAASAYQVKRVAFGCFGLAAVFGLILVALSSHWWLLIVGVACVLSAWYYTGGKHPYGYAGLGELFVFVFFGLVATVGTSYVQIHHAPWQVWTAAVAMGALACAVLVCNNLRDIATDRVSGKRTLEVALGDRGSRSFYAALAVVSAVALIVTAAGSTWWALLGLAMIVLLIPATRHILGGGEGLELVHTLKFTGLAELIGALGLFIGMLIGV